MANHRTIPLTVQALTTQRSCSPAPPHFKHSQLTAAHRSHHSRHKKKLGLWLITVACAACAAVISANRYLQAMHVAENPIKPHMDAQALDSRQHVANERLLRMVIEECSKQENTMMWVDKDGSLVVQQVIDSRQCPPIDIMLLSTERGIGMCTDAALYVIYAGARIIPALDKATPAVSQETYDSYCGPATARMLFETMYSKFISKQPGVLHIMLLNHEHLWVQDANMHRQIDVYLCKTNICQQLVQKHILTKRYKAQVWLMGHTSSDPSVDVPAGTKREQKLTFLHVKGKSGLKHTNQLLECWRGRPDFPHLTVIGRFSWSEAKDSINSSNIHFYPTVTEANADSQTEHISFAHIRQLQVQIPVHICASEREGFGHYLNEARAAGAVVISTDHPPMSEMVHPSIGLLVQPEKTSSYPEMALGEYTDINAFLSPKQLCKAVEHTLTMSLQDVAVMGQRAREEYLHDNAVFLARMQDLTSFLKARSIGAAAINQQSAWWRTQGLSYHLHHHHHRRQQQQGQWQQQQLNGSNSLLGHPVAAL